ncbi:MAG: hypothetical protein A2Y10_10140 [Planctomycetes bacterium GWF2_41_51]|nr:MAG: hypothetical protein A2Y10_10140 [Planctomycetes bacterium GWF2_41_51]HBG27701.1 hypothetical protein [Phycisphaerales bacterium]
MASLTSRERMLTAIDGGVPDRLPVTTHHLMSYFLNEYMNGASDIEFFDHFGLDAIIWAGPVKNEPSDNWRIEEQEIPGHDYRTIRYTIVTPAGNLATVIQYNEYTCWVTERLVKDKKDIDLIGQYVPSPVCDVESVNSIADNNADKLIRGSICSFDLFGQPGTWQDAACLFGIEKLIMATFDDPQWVHTFLKILQKRKKEYIASLKGAKYDILELGGGDASSTVISPAIFDEYVAPYDMELIRLAHGISQRIVYHTCGGMMPILENIAAMKPDAMETFTPPGMGGDVDLANARKRVPSDICMIGGFDQFHFFKDCGQEQTRAEVRRCFEAAGQNGAFILSPSDHFFDAEPELLMAFADEARKCTY